MLIYFSGKGGKNRRRGKNENEREKRELVFKEEGQGETVHYKFFRLVILSANHFRVCTSHQNAWKWTVRSHVLRWNEKTVSHQRKTEEKGLAVVLF